MWHFLTHLIITLESFFLIGVVSSLDEGAKVVVVRARSGLCGSSSNLSAALFWFLVTLDTYWTSYCCVVQCSSEFPENLFSSTTQSVFPFNHRSQSVWVNLIMVTRSLQSCDCTRESVADSIAPHAQYVTLQHDYSH